MKRQKKDFQEIPKWSDVVKEIPSDYKKELQHEQKRQAVLRERVKECWSLRESGFWLRFRGIKLYEEIKKAYFKQKNNEKAVNLLSKLDEAMDEWDNFISRKIADFRGSEKFQIWRKDILKRDGHKCKNCGNADNLEIHNIISLSENIAEYIKRKCPSIGEIEISEIDELYDVDNGITLCFRCYDNNDQWGDSQIDMHRMRIKNTYIETKNRQKEWFKLGDLHTEISKKLDDSTFDSKKWFCDKLVEVKNLQDEIAYSSHEPATGNRLFEIQLLFRIGEFDFAKRLAIRQERYFRREAEEREKMNLKKKKKNFAKRNRETILCRTIDKLVELYKQGDYRIRYTTPEAYEAEGFREIFRDAENEIRKEMGVPLIGEGWVTETEVFYLITDILSEYEVIHHSRPKWLEGQEFDIYIPELKIAVEYMGEQHYKPIDFFGGEEGFRNLIRLDKEKRKKAENYGVKVLDIKFDDKIERDSLRQKILDIME